MKISENYLSLFRTQRIRIIISISNKFFVSYEKKILRSDRQASLFKTFSRYNFLSSSVEHIEFVKEIRSITIFNIHELFVKWSLHIFIFLASAFAFLFRSIIILIYNVYS